MLVVYNNDRPGVIGNIGTTMGKNKVNIARLHLSLNREQAETGQALVVLTTDTMVTADILKKLRELPHVISVTQVEM